MVSTDPEQLRCRTRDDGSFDQFDEIAQFSKISHSSSLNLPTTFEQQQEEPNGKSRKSIAGAFRKAYSRFSTGGSVFGVPNNTFAILFLGLMLLCVHVYDGLHTYTLVRREEDYNHGRRLPNGADESVLARLIENRDVLSTQSMPTNRESKVMETPRLSDHRRKKILVTGGAGFVGSHLVDKLMMEGHEVTVLDNFFTGQKKNVAHWLHHPNFSLVVHDVTEPIHLEVDEIYHLACPASPPHYQFNPVKTLKTSTMGTLNMLGLAKRVKAKILLTSTSEIYGDPKVHPQTEQYWGNVNPIGPRSCYDEGKRVAETMMYSYRDQSNVNVRVARIFNTFGPRMHPNDGRVVSNFIIQSLQTKPLTVYGEGDQTRSFQYVSDLVDGLHALMNGQYDGPVNLGNPDEFTMKEFANYVKKLTKSDSEIRFLEKTEDDPSQRKPDITLAKNKLGWKPKVSVEEGLSKTIAYFQQVLDEAGEIIPTGPGASKPQN